MKRFTKTALALALGLATTAAFAGEIDQSTIYGGAAENTATGSGYAVQRIGAAKNGVIQLSTIDAQYTKNSAEGSGAVARQDIGVAEAGQLYNVYVQAVGAYNFATGANSTAVQEIGVAKGANNVLRNSYVFGQAAINQAGTGSYAAQKIGVVD